jgi:hypothetical protein
LRAFVVNWLEEASRGARLGRAHVRFTLVLRMLVLPTEWAEAMSFALWPSLAEGNEKILAKKFLPHGFVFAQSPLIV